MWQVRTLVLLMTGLVTLGCDTTGVGLSSPNHGTYLRIEPDLLTLAEGRVGTLRAKSDGEFVWLIHWSILEDWYVVSLSDPYGTSNTVRALAPGLRHVTVEAERHSDRAILKDTATVVVLPVTVRTLVISPDSMVIAANPSAIGGSLHGILRDSVGVELTGAWRSWSWISSDTSIVTLWVSSWRDGDYALVHGMRAGRVVVTAQCENLTATAVVTVEQGS